MMPVRETSPTVGFSPTSPVIDAGHVTEPSVSVPIAAAARLAATATPEPLLDPQAVRSVAYGLRVSPPTALQPLDEKSERMFAHSDRLLFPRMIAPASIRPRTTGASRAGKFFVNASDPAVFGR